MTIYIINGPNLNLLGKREPEIYGDQTFGSFYIDLEDRFSKIDLNYFQSNHEGALIDKLQEIGYTTDGIVLNPAAYTHTSIALADTIKAITSPVVEVHISDITQREDFRKVSYIKEHCIASIVGKGLEGYAEAIELLVKGKK